jgi:hypothetical protein
MENELKIDESVKAKIIESVRRLDTTFREYFPVMSPENIIHWMTQPFLNETHFGYSRERAVNRNLYRIRIKKVWKVFQ